MNALGLVVVLLLAGNPEDARADEARQRERETAVMEQAYEKGLDPVRVTELEARLAELEDRVWKLELELRPRRVLNCPVPAKKK